MAIINPTPVTPQVFDGMWITNLMLMLPTPERAVGMLHASLHPYDGANLLVAGRKDVRRGIPAQDAQTTALIATFIAEVKRQKDTDAEPVTISVMAQDPTKPVRASVRFAGNIHHNIPDCFALAATDSAFAQVLGDTMAEVARLAGLSVA